MLIWIVLALVVATMAYIRLAPSDPARWNRPAPYEGLENRNLGAGYVWRAPVGSDAEGLALLARLAQIAEGTARTELLTGSPEAGQLTVVTRSKLMGFPDYTTFSLRQTSEGQPYVEMFGRSRFGRSDLGVNAKRLRGWAAALDR